MYTTPAYKNPSLFFLGVAVAGLQTVHPDCGAALTRAGSSSLQLCSGFGPCGTFLLDSDKSCTRLQREPCCCLLEKPWPGGDSTSCARTASALGIRRPWQRPVSSSSAPRSNRVNTTSMNLKLLSDDNLMVVTTSQRRGKPSKEYFFFFFF